MEIKTVSIHQVEVWDKNPRSINKKDFVRLKKQITKLGVYKPLIVFEEKEKHYIALGGNMRLRALRELKYEMVDISIVRPKNNAAKLEYALSDNDRAGYYDIEKVDELVEEFKDQIDFDDFSIDLFEPKTVTEQINPSFEPTNEDGQGKLDEKKKVICPECKNEFTP